MDGTPSGLLTAEIMNWTGHVLTGPRSKLSELIQRREAGRTGIYFLVGPDPDNTFKSQVYIGESDDVGTRLKQRNRSADQGGKDFWERVCLVTSKDQNLTKAHVKHLESLLINSAKALNRCTLINGTNFAYDALPESDLADMAFFLEQIRTILPVLGFNFLREVSQLPVQTAGTPALVLNTPRFRLDFPEYNIRAAAQEVDGEFFVLQGSLARAQWTGPNNGYKALHAQLIKDGVLVPTDADKYVFASDYMFNSPSAAAAVICGRNANGRQRWQLEAGGQTYSDWQNQQVNAASVISGDSMDEQL